MSIIHETPIWDPYDRHECEPPYPYRTDKSRNTPAFGVGTVWECDKCGKHWWYKYVGLSFFRWDPVRWWNFDLRRKIKEST